VVNKEQNAIRELRLKNEKQSNQGGYKLLSRLALVGLIALAVGGYFYLMSEDGPVTLKVASGPYRSDSYELMKDVAAVVSRHSDDLIIKVIPSKNSSENISLLNKGKVDIATIRSDTPVVSDVRMIADLFPDYFQLISRSDSLIYSPTDLIGKTVAVPFYGTDELRSFWIVGDHYDIPIREVNWVSIPFEAGANKLLSGEVDAIFTHL